MPKEIIIELIPATNADWLHVHSMAQNPRLRTKLTMQQRISTLIAYLEKRWNANRLHQNTFRSLMGTDLDSKNDDDNETNISDNATTSNSWPNFRVRLRPQKSAKLEEKVTLKSTANSISYHNYRSTNHGTTQIDLSLSAYMANMFNDNFNSKKSKIRKSNKKNVSKEANNNKTESKDDNSKFG